MQLDEQATRHWLASVDWLNTSWLLFAVSVLWLIAIYLTRDLGPKKRQEFQKNLRTIHYYFVSAEQRLLQATDDSEVEQIATEFNHEWKEAAEWVRDNMGKFAYAKLVAGLPSANHHTWAGQHDPDIARKRSNLMTVAAFRRAIVDELLTSPAWDDPPPPKFIERLKWW